ncbi:MAG: alpha-1,2-fucosyltransferase [Rhodospirillaceae bacterium]
MTINHINDLSLEDLRVYFRVMSEQLNRAGQRDVFSRQIYLHAYGGLGNQLFQAAFAIVMGERLGADVNFLTISYRDDKLRPFLLHMFPGVRARIVPADDALGSSVFEENMVRHLPLELLIATISDAMESNKRVYFSGFWQDERYFSDRRPVIRELLRPEVSSPVEEEAKRIQDGEAIGLHVRRHGYGHMGLVRLSYYLEAIRNIRQERGDIPVMCFTDDPSFCQYVFRGVKDFSVADNGNTYNPIENFHILSSCRHHIIANSSFSWWAAWLSERSDSIVYAPYPWIIPDTNTNPVPQRWRRIPDAIQAP